MSIKVQSYVWEHSKAKGSALLLLLAIADHAHDDGGGAYPSVETLQKKCRQSERNTQRLLRELAKMNEIVILDQAGPHGCNVYKIPMGGAILAPLTTSAQGVQSSAEIVPQMSPEPSLTTIEPKEEESPAPKVNAYASYNAAFGEPIPNPSSPRVINAVEDLEEFPGAWIDTAFLRTSKKERSTNERWQDYRRLPYALSLLNEWKHAGAILPEKTPPKPSPAPPRAAPRPPAPPDADAARQRAIAEWKRARLANGMGIGASGKSP